MASEEERIRLVIESVQSQGVQFNDLDKNTNDFENKFLVIFKPFKPYKLRESQNLIKNFFFSKLKTLNMANLHGAGIIIFTF